MTQASPAAGDAVRPPTLPAQGESFPTPQPSNSVCTGPKTRSRTGFNPREDLTGGSEVI